MSTAADALRRAQAAFAAGDDAAATREARAALAHDARSAAAWLVLANSAIRRQRIDDAIAALDRLHTLRPDEPAIARQLATALNNRGARRRKTPRIEDALGDLRRATRLDPAHPQAWYNLALACSAAGDTAGARAAFARHLALLPDDVEAHLGAARLEADVDPARMAAHLDALRDAVITGAVMDVADELDRGGHPQTKTFYAAAARLGRDGERTPSLRAVFGRHLALPAVFASPADMRRARDGYLAGLDALEVAWDSGLPQCATPRLEQLAWSNFKLAYQGEDDREPQRRFATLLRRALPAMRPDALEPPPRHPGSTRRVGLLSSSWRECTAGVYFGGWIAWLREAGYDVHLYQLGPQRDSRTERLAAQAAHFVFHDGRLDPLADRLREDRLDLLLYPELGMDARLLPLAAMRLAHRQVVAWGHPVTTGFEHLDGYLTCAEMEPDGADAHYTERLLPLPGLGVDYARPPTVQPLARLALGLPERAPLVLLPQSAFKLHPDLDAPLAALAARVREARFVLIVDAGPWRDVLSQRFARAFADAGVDARDRFVWLSSMDRARYLAVNAACDLMLDAPHWSGGNASLDALHTTLPVLTVPGRFMRGRQTWAMLRRMGLEHSLAFEDAASLVDGAATLLAERERRLAIRAAIGDARQALFGDHGARAAFLDHVAGLCEN